MDSTQKPFRAVTEEELPHAITGKRIAWWVMDNGDPGQRLAAEQRARVLIDRQLVAAGWAVQVRQDLNLFAAQGVACREVTMKSGHGRADYLLYVGLPA
ncbi:MAG: hypothetical protein ACR2FV_02150 [Ornithinimicrobium sp.]|uniref:hypothetical protein n=1 Tax=Ornithinimicrobium sp. TaxID=1977084 RepID=UPI003D9BDC85